MFIGASNQLGEFESGVTAAWFGTVPAVLVGGFGTLAIVALWMRLFPALAEVDSLASDRGTRAEAPEVLIGYRRPLSTRCAPIAFPRSVVGGAGHAACRPAVVRDESLHR